MRRVLSLVFGLLLGGTTLAATAAFVWFHHQARAAELALHDYHLDDAQRHLDRCLAVWPWSTSSQLLAARTARRRDRLEEAERHLEAAERGGKTPATELERLLLQAQRGQVRAVTSRLYRMVDQKQPDAGLILEALGRGHLLQLNLPMAAKALDLLLRQQPDNALGYYLRGRLHASEAKDEKAIEDFRQAVERAPEMDTARLFLANRLCKQGWLREAIYHYEWLRQRNPGDGRVLVGLARCRMDENELAEAGQLLDRALVVDPDNVLALIERGRLALRTGQVEETLPGLRRATTLAPQYRDAWWGLHLCLEALGKHEEDRRCLDEVFRIENEALHLENLILQLAEHDDDLALRYEVGVRLLHVGRDTEGERVLTTLLEMDPSHSGARQALKEHQSRSGSSRDRRSPSLDPPL